MSNTKDLLRHPIIARTAAFLRQAGVPAWLVGGVVRDALLGRPLHDLDFAVSGDGMSLARRLANELGGAFVALDAERMVGRVVVVWEGRQLFVDLAALRGADGIEADLWLRDFTVNAMAADTTTTALIDPVGGLPDLQNRLIRAVSEQVFHDDPLRMLRALRLAGQLDFEIETATLTLIQRDAALITQPAAERVREELLGLLAPAGAAERVRLLEALGLLAHLLPELLLARGVTQSRPHILDVYEHSLAVLAAIEGLLPDGGQGAGAGTGAGGRESGGGDQGGDFLAPDLWTEGGGLAPWREAMVAHLAVEVSHQQPRWLLLKLAALFHDIGKPVTRSVGEDGRIHFYGHEAAGAEMARAILRRLKMPQKSIRWVERIVANHLRPLHLTQRLPPRRKTLYRYFRATGDAGPDVALLSIADQRGKGFIDDRAEVVAVARHLLAAYFEEYTSLVAVRPLLSGREVIELAGIEPGPRVSELLERLKEAQAGGHIRDRESAIRYLEDLTRK